MNLINFKLYYHFYKIGKTEKVFSTLKFKFPKKSRNEFSNNLHLFATRNHYFYIIVYLQKLENVYFFYYFSEKEKQKLCEFKCCNIITFSVIHHSTKKPRFMWKFSSDDTVEVCGFITKFSKKSFQ